MNFHEHHPVTTEELLEAVERFTREYWLKNPEKLQDIRELTEDSSH